MPRFFLPEDYFSNLEQNPQKLILTGDDAFHIATVLRMKKGEKLVVCNTAGMEFHCEIFDTVKRAKQYEVILSVEEILKSESEPSVDIHVFQGMPKGKKAEVIIQKSVELGAYRISFVDTDRAIAKFDESDGLKKIERYQKIADEAAKQCGRGKLVKVDYIENFKSAVMQMKAHECFFLCYEAEKNVSIKELLKNPFSSCAFFIGPEGGFSAAETELAKNENIPTVTLGKLILRAETAAAAVLSMLLYEKEL